MLGLVCAGSSALMVLVIVVFRRLTRGDGGIGGSIASSEISGDAGGESESVATRVIDDGFWIDGEFAVGTTVICRYSIGGQKHTVEIAPTEAENSRFVPTGARPESVVASVLSAPPY